MLETMFNQRDSPFESVSWKNLISNEKVYYISLVNISLILKLERPKKFTSRVISNYILKKGKYFIVALFWQEIFLNHKIIYKKSIFIIK